MDTRLLQQRQWCREHQRGDEADGCHVVARADGEGYALAPVAQRRAEADGALQLLASVADEVEAGVTFAFVARGAGGGENLARDLQLGEPRAASQLFDGRAVEIPRGEIHGIEIRGAVQHLVDEAHAFEELGPVHIGHQAHAGDDVAHRDVRSALALVLFADQLLGARALRSDARLQPLQCRHHIRVLVAQPLHQLHREGRRQRLAGAAPARQRLRIELLPVHSQQAVGNRVGFLARGAAGDDALRDAAQVFDENDAQRDRDRPELADGQRRDTLIGAHETAQRLRFEPAVGMGNIGPGDAEHPREPGERALGQLGQLAVEAGRQILADLADLLLDHVVVVEHPLGGGGDAAAFVHGPGDGPVGRQHDLFVVAQAGAQRTAEFRPARDALRGRERLGVLLQALGAEDLLAQDLLVVPMRAEGEALQDSTQKWVQGGAVRDEGGQSALRVNRGSCAIYCRPKGAVGMILHDLCRPAGGEPHRPRAAPGS